MSVCATLEPHLALERYLLETAPTYLPIINFAYISLPPKKQRKVQEKEITLMNSNID